MKFFCGIYFLRGGGTLLNPTKLLLKVVLDLLLDVLVMLLEVLDLSWRSWRSFYRAEGPNSFFSVFFLETLKSYSIFNTTVRFHVKFYIRLVGRSVALQGF